MKDNLQVWLIFSGIIFGLLAILSLLPIMFSPMLFDSPGSQNHDGVWMFVYSLISFPVVVLISIIVAWKLYKSNNLKDSLLTSLLPFVNIILAFLGIIQM